MKMSRTLPLIKPPFPFGVPFPFSKKKVNRYYITLKVEENDQYKIGDVKVTGAKELNEAIIRLLLGLVPGQVYNETALRKWFRQSQKTLRISAAMSISAPCLSRISMRRRSWSI